MNQTRRPHAKQPNYRLLLCIGLLVCLVLDILFFVLFLSQCSRAGGLEDEVKKLTEANQALTSQNTMLQQQSDAALTTAVAALPDPTTAQTTNLPDLIPQLTDAVYVVRTTGEGYQYLKIAEGAVLDLSLIHISEKLHSSEAEEIASRMALLLAQLRQEA